MRGPIRARLTICFLTGIALAVSGCSYGDKIPVPDREGAVKSTAQARAERRAYDGAPPTIPHKSFGTRCTACHNAQGQSVGEIGFAPASPHEGTAKADATIRCRQCHVFVTDGGLFVASEYEPLEQNLRHGGRATPGAPPTIPHRVLMRENCVACHDGPGAREEVRTTHSERWRCRQCHVPSTTRQSFESELGEVYAGAE